MNTTVFRMSRFVMLRCTALGALSGRFLIISVRFPPVSAQRFTAQRRATTYMSEMLRAPMYRRLKKEPMGKIQFLTSARGKRRALMNFIVSLPNYWKGRIIRLLEKKKDQARWKDSRWMSGRQGVSWDSSRRFPL